MSHPRSNAGAANSSRKSNGISIQKSPQSDDQLLRRAQQDRQRYSHAIVDPGDGGRDGYGGSSDRQERTLRPSSSSAAAAVLAEDGRQEAQRQSVVRRKNFRHMEKVNGKMVNVLQGLELHTGVFSAEDQKKIVDCIYDLQEKGRRGMLKERTYSEPRKWMRGKGRVTIQFGCCYNYATDKHGNPPGIIRDEYVDPIPPLLKEMIKRMVAWQVLPRTCVPNSCIVNIYDEDDCIPPHIDHHDFLRPFCTVSFLSECNILFGTELKVLGPGEFSGSSAIPLPVGSVLILNGNGADIAKHCVPAVPSKRISITFRKMDESKIPYEFVPDPDLQNLTAMTLARPPPPTPTPPSSVVLGQNEGSRAWPVRQQQDSQLSRGSQNHNKQEEGQSLKDGEKKKASVFSPPSSRSPFQLQTEDFPPLGSAGHANKRPSRPIRQ